MLVKYGRHCVPGWQWRVQPGEHAGLTLWSVWGGRGMLRLGADIYMLRAGDMFLIDYAEAVEGTEDADYPLDVRFIDFSREYIPSGSALPKYRRCARHEFFQELLTQAERAQNSRDLPQTALWLQAVIYAYAAQPPCEKKTDYSDKIEDISAVFHSCPQKKYDIRALAAECGLTPDHFIRVFKAQKGLTPYAYLQKIRAETAASLLINSSMSVSDTANACGFPDVYSFSRFFKAKTGCSPSEYRNRKI